MRRNEAMVLGMSAAALLAACGEESRAPEGEGWAVLTAVGHPEILVGAGWEHEIEVRYHDLQGEPLAGAIEFSLGDDESGAYLTDARAHTDERGYARTKLVVGDGDATLSVRAEAAEAHAVTWDVEVSVSTPPLRLGGEYVVESELAPLTSLPQPAIAALGELEAMTEREHGVGTWLLDAITAEVQRTSLRRAIAEERPELDEALEQVLVEASPRLSQDIDEIAALLDEAAGGFGTTTVLQIGSGDSDAIERTGPVAVHTLTGMTFQVAGGTYHFATGLGKTSARSSAVRVSALGLDQVEIGEHELQVRYGTMLVSALEQVILPRVASPHVRDLETFLRRNVDCAGAGELLAERVPDGSAAEYRALCELSVEAVAEVVADELRALDGAGEVLIALEGLGMPYGVDGDEIVDRIEGSWTGAVVHHSGTSEIDGDASPFSATRVDVR